jgi:hypothetical protein
MGEKADKARSPRYQSGDSLALARVKLRKTGQLKKQVKRRPGPELAELWKIVARERADLDSLKNRPVLDSLSESWKVLDEYYDGLIKRADKHHVAATPLEALFQYVEMGFYPPPELLLALLTMWETYLHGGGMLSLESVFLGPPKKKAGGHAQRHRTWARYIHMGIRLEALEEEGHSTLRAAEIISEELSGKPEPESIVRLVNANYFLRKRKNKRPS